VQSHTLDLRNWVVGDVSRMVTTTGTRRKPPTDHDSEVTTGMRRTASNRPRRVRITGLTGVALLGLVACGGGVTGAGPDHEPVSVAPESTASASPERPLSLSGVASSTLDPAGFGMHVLQIAEEDWPDVPVGSIRVWNGDSTWGALEPSPGSWDFARLDQRVAQAESRGAPVLLVLSHPPAWAATRPDLQGYQGSPSPPTANATWQTYVRTVVERYAGRIEAYEIWNEPNLTQFYAGTPQRLAELTELASAEIRAADPEALVVSAGFSARTAGSQPFFTTYVNAMAPEAIDVVGIHIYPYPGDGPESMISLATTFRSLADAAGLGAAPMWNTEIGYGRAPSQLFAGDAAASLILRTYLVLPASGVARNYWYMWDDRQFIGLYLVEADRSTETPAAFAYADAQRWLAEASIIECGDQGDGLWTCQLRKDGQVVTVAWKLGAAASFSVPDGTTVAYPFTGDPVPVEAGATVELGELPVLYAPVEIPSLVG
jgi:hypothetical protein